MKKLIRKLLFIYILFILFLIISYLYRYCLPNGYYTLVLVDDDLVTSRLKHAKVIFSSGSANETLIGTSQVNNFPVGVDKKETKSNDDDDDVPVTQTVGFIVGITLGCVALAAILGCIW